VQFIFYRKPDLKAPVIDAGDEKSFLVWGMGIREPFKPKNRVCVIFSRAEVCARDGLQTGEKDQDAWEQAQGEG
jgi:hypothetical protein